MSSTWAAYPDYKAAESLWFEKIPVGWYTPRIKAVLVERNEKNDPVVTSNILSLSMHKGVIPYSERDSGGNKSKSDLSSYKVARVGDIVLNSMNVIVGSVGLSRYFGAISPVYYALFCKDDSHDIRYYNYVFQSVEFQKSLFGLGNGILIKESASSGKQNTIRMRIPIEKLLVQLIPSPPAEEQQKIAQFLDHETARIDTLIEKQQQLIALLKEKRQAVISHAVTKGLEPDVPMRDSGVEWLGEVPEGWGVLMLRHLGELQNGINIGAEYFGEGFPFYSYGDVYKNRVLPDVGSGLVRSSVIDRDRYSVASGDVFFTRTSETVDEIGIAATCKKSVKGATFAGFLIRFRPTTSQLTAEYLEYLFSHDLYRDFFIKEMNLVTRASLSQDLLKRLSIPVPSKDEQLAIAKHLESESARYHQLEESALEAISLLKEKKSALVSASVTGKIDVRDWQPPKNQVIQEVVK